MPVIVQRFEGGDLVIPGAALAGMGVEPGQYIAIRPMAPIPLLEVRVVPREQVPAAPRLAWTSDTQDEADAECAHEDAWQIWAAQAG